MDGASPQARITRSGIAASIIGSVIVLFFPLAFAHAASLFISPAAESVAVGQTFTMSVNVASADTAMNAASGDILFPSDKLQVLSVSKAGSVMNLWIRDPSFTNSQAGGDVHFEGVVLNPGFMGDSGNLIKITFEAIAAGDAPISFSSGAVLANDGNGTNILTVMQPGDVTIAPRSATAPPVSSGLVSAGGTPLGPLTIMELSGQDPTNPQPIFTWNTGGAITRGITYSVRIGNGDWFDASTILVSNTRNEYQLPLQAPIQSTSLTVYARDPAGHSTSSTISFSIAPITMPSIIDYTRVVPAFDQLFSVEGTAPTGTTVKVYLQKPGSIITYEAQTDSNGQWSLAEQKAMASGMWKLSAQAVDARGALSAITPFETLQVNSWFNDLFGQIIDLGIIGLVMIILTGGLVFLTLIIIHRIRKWHMTYNREMIELEERLRGDIGKIEKKLDDRKEGQL